MLKNFDCGELTKKQANKNVTLCGWVDSLRTHGKIGFIDLRDRSGTVQLFLDKKFTSNLKDLTRESVIQITGKVGARPKNLVNRDMKTGDVEVKVAKLNVLTKADPLPLEIDKNIESLEETRLKYRYLDLRRPEMQEKIELRHKAIKFIRDFLDKKGFYEITTPILTKSTPEGARDYLVPSRIHKGKFYALPQSPQQYKQLLMVAGFEKYFQIAPCFRDEDARADRCPGEFYQLDLEMSFVEQEDILKLTEKLFIELIKKVFPGKKISKTPFPRLKYKDCIKKYGTDKPDLRKNKKNENELAFCWVVDFPLFEEKLEKGHCAPKHHMFTMPKEEHLKYLNKKDARKALSYQHDLVLNGFEVGGGSIRIHDPKVQEKIFDLIGFDKKKKKYFSHMLDAFRYGVPVHGGIAPGLDRTLMVILGEQSIREVIAFPKSQDAKDLTMDAPSKVEKEQLEELDLMLHSDLKKYLKK
ncbi:aspartate--tRNA ligase [archaeon]|nr:aspartate--tRNA ligase [archaeon]